METANVVVFALHYLAAMALFGAAQCRLVLGGDPAVAATDRHLRQFLRATAALALLSALAAPLATAASMAGSWSAASDPATIGSVMTGTQFGIVWSWRFVPVALALVAATATKPDRQWTAAAAMLTLASLGLVGHAAMDEGWYGSFRRVTHAVHLLAAGAWLGGLIPLALLMAATRADPGRAVRALHRFSTYAIAAVVLVVVTGVLNTIALIPHPEGLATDYGHVLIAKLVLVLVLVALALVNRLWLTPALGTAPGRAALRLRASIRIEIAVGAAVVVIASLLGTLSPPIR